MNLTPAQEEVLKYVDQHIKINGYAPTFKEISDYFDWSGVNAARGHLLALSRKGKIKWVEGKSRTLQVIR